MSEAGSPALADGRLLAAGLIHELRQPLTALQAAVALAARGSGDGAAEEWLMARLQLARIEETLESYTRLLDGRTEPVPFEVEALVRRAVQLLEFRLRRLDGRFAVAVEPAVPLAYGAAGALLHALTNLIVNALDAADGAGRPARVEVRVLPAPDLAGRAQVRVADDGRGVAPELCERIFDPAFTTKPNGSGMGLGLHIARRMMERCGGAVRLLAADDPARRPWSRTEFAIDLAGPPAANRAAG